MPDPRAIFEGTPPWTPDTLAASGWTMVGTLWVGVSGGRRLILLSDGKSDRCALESMVIHASDLMARALRDG